MIPDLSHARTIFRAIAGASSGRSTPRSAPVWLARGFAALVLAATLTGCALTAFERQAIRPGQSLAEVDGQVGSPSAVSTAADGTRTAWYVYGPGGWHTWRVRYGADGRVTEVRQVLTPDYFSATLKADSTTRATARDTLGPPGLVTRFPNINREVWIYRWLSYTTSMRLDLDFEADTGVLKSWNVYVDPCPRSTLNCMGT
jgi:hypothetical protein